MPESPEAAVAPPGDTPKGGRHVPLFVRFFLEILPSVVFLAIYYSYPDVEGDSRLDAIVDASIAEAATSFGLGLFFWAYTRRIPWLMIQSTVISAFSAGMTVALDSDLWFKMRGTVLPAFGAALLLGFLWAGHNLLKMGLSPYWTNLSDRGWDVIAVRVAYYQLAMAAINEALWRTQPFDLWLAITRALGPTASALFALFFFAPVVIHEQKLRRLNRPAENVDLPQVISIGVERELKSGGEPLPPLALELGPPGPAPKSGNAALAEEDPTAEGLPPVELRRGSTTQLVLWIRSRTGEQPPPLVVDVTALAFLVVPFKTVSAQLEPTGKVRVAQSPAAMLGTRTGGSREFEFRAAFRAPSSLLASGSWLSIVNVRTVEHGYHVLLWMQSITLVGSYSRRTLEALEDDDREQSGARTAPAELPAPRTQGATDARDGIVEV
jgi:intracellular septation protein